MSEPLVGAVLDRLRANLHLAGIPFTENDLAAMVERGNLWAAIASEADSGERALRLIPDDLDPGPSPVARASAREPADEVEWPRASDSGSSGVPLDASLLAIAERLRTRELSPVELCEHCLGRAAERAQPWNAFAEVLEDRARAEAKRAEEEIATGRWRGPLHGVPVAVKDLFAIRGTRTRAGSRVMPERPETGDAAVVERLHSAGAVVIGKTLMAELAYSPSSHNVHYGHTPNVWNPERNAGGSSSGSAVAVADGSAFAALGTDTGGSIRIPAAYCGIVGLKPTFGRVSLHGALPLSWSLDHAGPMTRTVADAWALLLVLAGVDPRDPRTRRSPSARFRPEESLDQGVRGLRIGVPTDGGDVAPAVEPEALAAWRLALAMLERAGAEIVTLALSELGGLARVGAVIQQVESSTFHEATLRDSSSLLGDFARHRLLAGFAHGPLSYVRAQRGRALLRRRCEAWFESVDLVSLPTMPSTATPLDVVPPTTRTIPFNVLGWPAVSVPAGHGADGLPLAIQIVGPPWQEARVLCAARVVEAETGGFSVGAGAE